MKISSNWLREWVQNDKSADEIAQLLTDSGLEVDGIEPLTTDVAGVIVGEITAIEKHPDADRLNVCQVNLGSETAQIVCGAPNAHIGLKAPVATVGTTLPNGLKIKKAKLRGVESSGMLCSESELGFSDASDGLMELSADAIIGMNIGDYLGDDDDIIDVDITPNRGDCLSLIGIARDFAAKSSLDFSSIEVTAIEAKIDDTQEVELKEPEGCAVFAGRLIKGVTNKATSPQWLKERLRRSGLRPISPIVDITNLVMLELGQPMHAYDADKLSGLISVRLANGNEKLTLIDGKEVIVAEDTLVVSDESGAIGLGGIMGGASTAISDSTTNIYLEAAWWHPNWIMGRMRRYGLATDAGQRFERGVDRDGQARAIERATQLVIEILGGEAGPVVVNGEAVEAPKDIRLRGERIGRLLGTEVDISEASAILTRLNIENRINGNDLVAQSPSWRFDIAAEWDLIEEVARIKGYDSFPTRAPVPIATHEIGGESDVSLNRIIDRMVDLGYSEVVGYSFVDKNRHARFYGENSGIELMNPIAQDLSLMRDGLIPSLMSVAEHNINHQHRSMRIFELGRRYFLNANNERDEEVLLSALITGNRYPISWSDKVNSVDFFDLKGDLERLLFGHGTLKFTGAQCPWLHPGRSADITLISGEKEEAIGLIGQVHPDIASEYDIAQDVYVFELRFDALLRQVRPIFKPYSTYPAIKRDLAFMVSKEITSDDIVKVIQECGGENLVDITIFDVFTPENNKLGEYSIAFSLTFQSIFSTLVDTEIDTVITEIVTKLTDQLAMKLRQ